MRSAGVSVGAAAFIDKEGYAITHQLTIARNPNDLQTSKGEVFRYKVIQRDTPSQLVLIKTDRKPISISTLEAATTADSNETFAFAVFAHGPAKAELTNAGTIGVDESSRRSVPMAVVRTEQSISPIGGGLLINQRGHIMGAFAATLATSQAARNQSTATPTGKAPNQKAAPGGVKGGAQSGLPNGSQANFAPNLQRTQSDSNLGPQGMIIGYSPTWEVMAKAISGFKSPEHKAAQGLLGVFVVDSPEGGLYVKEFFPNSPAQEAGLEVGDIITQIGDRKMKSQMDFARVTYRLIPNSNIVITVRRGDLIRNFLVKVGVQLSARSEGLGSSTGDLSHPEIH
jgi:S1-C subfamily serine protease